MPAYKYKTKDGKQLWYASFHYTDWKNEPKRKVKRGFSTRKEALEFERAFLDHGKKDPSLLFSTLAEEYTEDIASRLKPTTLQSKKHVINSKLIPAFRKTRVCDIDARKIRLWQNELMDYKDKKGNGYAQTYLRNIHSQMSAIMNYAVKYYGLAQNPCFVAGVMGKGRAGEMTIWSRDQFESAMKYEKRSAFHAALYILFYTGMREGELLALTPEDIPADQHIIHINKNYAVVDGEEMFLTPKTECSIRDVPIHKKLHEEIQAYISGSGIEKDERIFYFRKDGLLSSVKKIARKAELPQIRVHDLRHSHASMLIEMGVPITEISKRLGHDSPATTLRIYSHLYPGKERSIADMLDQLHGEPDKDV